MLHIYYLHFYIREELGGKKKEERKKKAWEDLKHRNAQGFSKAVLVTIISTTIATPATNTASSYKTYRGARQEQWAPQIAFPLIFMASLEGLCHPILCWGK